MNTLPQDTQISLALLQLWPRFDFTCASALTQFGKSSVWRLSIPPLLTIRIDKTPVRTHATLEHNANPYLSGHVLLHRLIDGEATADDLQPFFDQVGEMATNLSPTLDSKKPQPQPGRSRLPQRCLEP